MLKVKIVSTNSSGLIANLHRARRGVHQRVQGVMRRNLPAHVGELRRNAPRRSGRTKRLTKGRLWPSGLGYEAGWYRADYESEGQRFYILYYLRGTRTRPARDFVTPLRLRRREIVLGELRRAIKVQR